MACKRNKNWDTAITIAGGVAIGTCAVAAIVAAPIEIGLTAALLAGTKYALGKKECTKEHEHCDE